MHVPYNKLFGLTLFLLLSACEREGASETFLDDTDKNTRRDTDTGAQDDTDTTTTTLDDGFFRNVEAEVSDEVATVVTVRWTTVAPATGYVEYSTDDTQVLLTPEETEL